MLLLTNNISYATAQLILFTDKTEGTLGRPIRAELYGISLNTKITDINLQALSKDFGVITDYVTTNTTDKRWPNQPIQILKLKLYPRKAGKIIIPALTANHVISKNKQIYIKNEQTGVPLLSLSKVKPFQREQIVALINISSPDSTSRLTIKQNMDSADFESRPLHFKRIKKQNGSYQLQIGWTLSALKSGSLNLEFPPVEYSVSGILRKKFYLPKQTINVKVLPSYLPPTIPVGNISFKSRFSHTGILQPGTISYWNIELSGKQNNAYRLPAILKQIKSDSNVKFLPVNSERTTNSTYKNTISSVTHSIPFKANSSGLLKLPELHLQYFDPISEKIKTKLLQTENIIVLNLFLKSLILIIIFISLGYLLWQGYTLWQKYYLAKIKRNLAIQILQTNTSIKAIQKSIHLIAEAEYWSDNLTINQWGDLWGRKYKVNDNFTGLINHLNVCVYSVNDKNNINKVKQQLLESITNRIKL